MQVHISIGENQRFELREALLIYGDRRRSFVTRHQVTIRKDGPPTLEPAQPLTLGFLESLVRSLSGSSTAEVLPENVLAKGDRMIAWWTAACRRRMFYENSEQKAKGLNGRTFPQSPLVWRVDNSDLKIRALAENRRPAATTTLAVAPFWNLSDDGRVVGAGGTGSAIVMGLPYLDQAMRVWGHRYGLDVAMMDADQVSETNCVRQPFSISDIGQNKGTVLINRINLFWGTSWSAIPNHFHARSFDRNEDRCPDLVFGCVDSRAARKAIEDSFSRALSRTCYWLDLGNNASSGQFVLGQPLNARNRRKADRLRTVIELFPEIVDAEAGEDP